MDASTLDAAAVLASHPGPAAKLESPARLLLLAVAWVVIATIAGAIGSGILGFVVGWHNGVALHQQGPQWRPTSQVYTLVALVGSQLTLLFAAWRRARVVGHGDLRLGFDDRPLRRLPLLAGLAVLQLVLVFGWLGLLSRWLPAPPTPQLGRLANAAEPAGMLLAAGLFATVVVLAPISEELFFRGWLWTGLRRRWSVGPVMLMTGLPWLLAHGTEGLQRPLYLLPAAIMFGVARQFCGGVRASIVLHVLNNLGAAILIGMLSTQHTG